MSRLQTMAKLHESLFAIQMEIEDYDEKIERLQAGALKKLADGCTESQVHAEWKKMRAAQIHRRAGIKSQEILICTIYALEDQANIQNMNRLIQYTVKQHQMAHRDGLVGDSQHDNLVEAFEQIAQNVSKSQDAMDTLDTHNSEIENELDMDENNIVHQDTAFSRWKLDAQRENAQVFLAPIPDNILHQDEHKINQNRQENQRELLENSLSRAYG